MTRLSQWLEPINCQLVMDDTFGARWIEGETKRAERVRSEPLIRNHFVTAEEGRRAAGEPGYAGRAQPGCD